MLSNGSFPRIGKRDRLTHGERNQLRDVMILAAHVRSGSDIFVTNEVKAFGEKGSPRRQKLETLCATQIMKVEDFCAYCEELRRNIGS